MRVCPVADVRRCWVAVISCRHCCRQRVSLCVFHGHPSVPQRQDLVLSLWVSLSTGNVPVVIVIKGPTLQATSRGIVLFLYRQGVIPLPAQSCYMKWPLVVALGRFPWSHLEGGRESCTAGSDRDLAAHGRRVCRGPVWTVSLVKKLNPPKTNLE